MSEKTEQPTAKRLRDARKKGQVAKSREVVSAALIIALFGFLAAMMSSLIENLSKMILEPALYYGVDFEVALEGVANVVYEKLILIIAPFVATAAAVGVIANLGQFGLLFSPEALMPKLSNISPASGVKKIFNKKNLIEFLKSVIKIGFLAGLLYILIRSSLQELTRLPYCGMPCLPVLLGNLLFNLIIYTSAAFVIVAFADYIFQHWQFIQENKMTKDEVKREFKESQGDPHIKSHRRQFHQEMLQGDVDDAVRGSRAVVTNPIHLAVALKYKEGETPLPIIAAKGQRLIAKRIVKIANEEGIPVLENIPVARGLYEHGELRQYIPSEMVEGVAQVLRAVMELERKRES